MSEDTPTTERVRKTWIDHMWPYGGTVIAANEFDAWLVEHDRQVAADSLRAFAHSIPDDVHDPRHIADMARARANSLTPTLVTEVKK